MSQPPRPNAARLVTELGRALERNWDAALVIRKQNGQVETYHYLPNKADPAGLLQSGMSEHIRKERENSFWAATKLKTKR